MSRARRCYVRTYVRTCKSGVYRAQVAGLLVFPTFLSESGRSGNTNPKAFSNNTWGFAVFALCISAYIARYTLQAVLACIYTHTHTRAVRAQEVVARITVYRVVVISVIQGSKLVINHAGCWSNYTCRLWLRLQTLPICICSCCLCYNDHYWWHWPSQDRWLQFTNTSIASLCISRQ